MSRLKSRAAIAVMTMMIASTFGVVGFADSADAATFTTFRRCWTRTYDATPVILPTNRTIKTCATETYDTSRGYRSSCGASWSGAAYNSGTVQLILDTKGSGASGSHYAHKRKSGGFARSAKGRFQNCKVRYGGSLFQTFSKSTR